MGTARSGQEGDVEMVESLLRQGADPNVRDAWSNNTCLMLATDTGNVPIVQLLLKHGSVDMTATNRDQMTALMIAKAKQDTTLIDLLASK
jgi:ankyrin repeat protein